MLENQLKDYVIKENLLSQGERILVGFSGGADSLALLILLDHIKEDIGISIGAAHLNHDLRGEFADEDEAYCKNFCGLRKIPFYSRKVDVKAYAKMNKISVELAGREIRYAFFKDIMINKEYDKCATAHHLDDQAESILLNLMRGASLSGLTGMQPIREEFIKPLLFIQKKELLGYLKVQEITPREDESNQESLYQRNKVRNHLIPYIKEHFNENIEETLVRMGRLIQIDLNFLNDVVQKEAETLIVVNEKSQQITLKKEAFQLNEAILSRLVLEAIRLLKHNLKDVEEVHVKDIMALAHKETGKNIYLKEGIMVRNNYGELIFEKNSTEPPKEPLEMWLDIPGEYVALGKKITLRLIEKDEMKKDKCLRFFNGDLLENKILLRHRKDGDTMRPLGMGGYKKIKNILIDKKIDREKRDKLFMFQNNKDIFYIGEMMISDDYKVKESTTKIVEIGIFEEDKND
ncbi:MAG: tRNA lysidine(34) synthetase TilS [Clostridium sp.]|nr:tRNA lysidine(34) synthetase TilS [Clostridium sp.]